MSQEFFLKNFTGGVGRSSSVGIATYGGDVPGT